jgi:formate dehydrogenase subunit gamma
MAPLLLAGVPHAIASTPSDRQAAPVVTVPNPGSDLWRNVRARTGEPAGLTQVRGVETGRLINPNGDKFQQFRSDQIIEKGKWVLVAVVGILLAFFLISGRARIKSGLTGEKILRFDIYKRVLHWVMAVLFLFLAITGLILLFGRYFMLPWMGPEAFGVVASASKEGHNLFGPLFLLSVIMFLFSYACRNIPRWVDIKWMFRMGGLLGKGHPDAGFFNGGEKIWFWLVMVGGLIISVTGLVLVMQMFGQGRELMQLSLIVHAIAAIILIGGSFGHMYMSFNIEGAMDSMTTGYVEKNWAKEHHNLWADKCEQDGKVLSDSEFKRTQGVISDRKLPDEAPAEETA